MPGEMELSGRRERKRAVRRSAIFGGYPRTVLRESLRGRDRAADRRSLRSRGWHALPSRSQQDRDVLDGHQRDARAGDHRGRDLRGGPAAGLRRNRPFEGSDPARGTARRQPSCDEPDPVPPRSALRRHHGAPPPRAHRPGPPPRSGRCPIDGRAAGRELADRAARAVFSALHFDIAAPPADPGTPVGLVNHDEPLLAVQIGLVVRSRTALFEEGSDIVDVAGHCRAPPSSTSPDHPDSIHSKGR